MNPLNDKAASKGDGTAEHAEPSRRTFIKAAALAVPAGIVVPGLGTAQAATEPVAQAMPRRGYLETDHVKTAYALARF